ncbi:MAG TPA: SDR family NAD(P)-dependent oxidoreductase [Acidimicrobiales bacterium]|jgi:NAD(P)-dependent dehydrogenase (short-subunit alcohol dehydrogenase family)
MDRLDGRTAVITGGASGIGLATARRLAAEGMHVVLADVEQAALDRAAASIDGALAVRCDVSDLADVRRLADAAREAHGAVHLLFANAGVATSGPVVQATHADWEWTIGVNLWGAIHAVEAFLPGMVDGGEGGHLLFTSSFAGLVANVGLGPYCVSKYGVVALAEVLHKELRRAGIGVSVVCPMRVATDIYTSGRNRPDRLGGPPSTATVPGATGDEPDVVGRVLPVEDVAAQVVAAVRDGRLYVLTHEESLEPVRRRFARIERDAGG